MNATKRKFNALLNGIGNKSTTSLAPIQTIEEQAEGENAKKRRTVALTSNPYTDPYSNSFAGSKLQEIKNRKIAPTKKIEVVPAEAPKYAPWDRAAFLKRLKSFANIADWSPKPPKVNEVEWAKRGWVCQKAERVRCCSCNVEILVKLNRKMVDGNEEMILVEKNIEEALVEKYVEIIVTSHMEDCLWRQRGCDDSIFKLPLNNPQVTLQGILGRYKELCLRKDSLPYEFNLRLPLNFDLDAVLKFLPANFFPEIELSQMNKVAFQMALFGWQGHRHERLGEQLGSVSCHACSRILGLWLFKSKAVNESGEETVGAAMNVLDVAIEHRTYCPWRNAASQNGLYYNADAPAAALAGWEVLLRVLKNDHYLRHNMERLNEVPKPVFAPDNVSEISSVCGTALDGEDNMVTRDEKDKERWARLKRVKSLFESKKKPSRPISKVKQ